MVNAESRCYTNNFEKRLFLDYLDKLINYLDLRSYTFDDVLEFFLYQFKVKRSHFKFDNDGVLLTETMKQRREVVKKLKTIVKELIEKTPVLSTKLEQRFLLIKEIYNLNENEYQSFLFCMIQEINKVLEELNSSIKGCSFDVFAKHYLGVRFCIKEQIINNLYLSKLITNKSNYKAD